MFAIEELLDVPPFGLDASAKKPIYQRALSDLTGYHYERSPEFRRIADLFGYQPNAELQVMDLPYIPVRLFKEFDPCLSGCHTHLLDVVGRDFLA